MVQHVDIEIRGLDSSHHAFRFETFRQARTLHINGYVKNISSDALKIVAVGKAQDVNEFINWCHRFFDPGSKYLQHSLQSGSIKYNDFLIMD